jgi:hypothetical protein
MSPHFSLSNHSHFIDEDENRKTFNELQLRANTYFGMRMPNKSQLLTGINYYQVLFKHTFETAYCLSNCANRVSCPLCTRLASSHFIRKELHFPPAPFQPYVFTNVPASSSSTTLTHANTPVDADEVGESLDNSDNNQESSDNNQESAQPVTIPSLPPSSNQSTNTSEKGDENSIVESEDEDKSEESEDESVQSD